MPHGSCALQGRVTDSKEEDEEEGLLSGGGGGGAGRAQGCRLMK